MTPRSLTADATVAELTPHINWMSEWAGVPAPSSKTVINWASKRDLSGFPEPVGLTYRGGTRRLARTFSAMQVFIWYLDRVQRQGRFTRGLHGM